MTESDAVVALLMGPNDCRVVEHGFRMEPSCVFPSTTKLDEGSNPPCTIDEPPALLQRRPRSGSEGLDYLAFLAEQERRVVMPVSVATSESSLPQELHSDESDDSEMMPPPQPRRPRSRSEDGYFVLPPLLLQKELEEARMLASARRSPTHSIPEDSEYVEEEDEDEDSNDYVEEDQYDDYDDDMEDEEEVEEERPMRQVETISSAELLRRARSRLLEDLSESNASNSNGDKGFTILPHALSKYQSVRQRSYCMAR